MTTYDIQFGGSKNNMTAEEWNEAYNVGQIVHYHPVIGKEKFVQTETRESAWTLDGGQHVTMIKGISGCVSLDSLSVPTTKSADTA